MGDRPDTVDEYLARLEEPARSVLAKLRAQIKVAAPLAREVISYRIPTYLHHGPLVHFAAWPKHLSLYAVGPRIQRALREDLKPFEISGHTIHFRPERPLPATLVRRIVKARLAENEQRARKPRPARAP